ncbi:HHIP-like protein 1 [Haliotis cracherodii]|uniref:HHIP-like protein 1 n=1 Tax=Haliotis cracherodii TaxID=6455 RepID=UPI0039EAF5C4
MAGMKNTVHLLTILITCLITVSPHPQCLDYRPPFQAQGTNNFCAQYTDFGCCTEADHDALRQRRDDIQSRLGDRWSVCGHYVDDLLCQYCSPYAAHIYDAEATQNPRQFPGLCRPYCNTFYDTCRDVVQYLDPELARMPSFASRQGFCQAVAIPSDVDYCYPDLLTNPLFTDQITNTQVNTEGCLCLEEQLHSMRNPIVARHAGDRSGRLFVGEQLGYVHIYFPGNKTGLQTPFLNITKKVKVSARRGDERGFFSIAFHPNYADNGRFFVYYSTHLQDNDNLDVYGGDIPIDHKIRISEIHVSQDDPNRADLDTERILLEVMEPYWNHNGGELLFGDDHYLYLFVGDGGAAADPHGFAQNKSVHLGKILRLDVDTPNPSLPYSIPPDNPFIDDPEARPEIYAYGVRNIWRCGKDRGDRQTGEGRGRIVCGDVGQSAWEEIDLVKKGANYGWNAREGFQCFNEETCGNIGPEELPIFAYPHRVGKSVTGGVFYRGCESPNLNGMYFYADYMFGQMYALTKNESGEWHNKEIFMCEADVCLNGLIGHYERYVISFGEDEEGEVYLLSTGTESATGRGGKVYKLIDPSRRGNPSECQHAGQGARINNPGNSRYTTRYTSNNPGLQPAGGASSPAPNQAPSIHGVNIRTCAMATTVMCVLMSLRH